MIYLIVTKDDKLCKIGKAVSPTKRLKQLQTGCPYELYIKETVEGDVTLESYFHKKYKIYKTHGEWFNYSENISLKSNYLEICYENELKINKIFYSFIYENFNSSQIGRIFKLLDLIEGDKNLLFLNNELVNKKTLFEYVELTRNRFSDFIKLLIKVNLLVEVDKNFIFNPYYVKRKKLIDEKSLCYFNDLRS